MSQSSQFEKLVAKLPVSWERLLGWGLSYFLERQDPEEVNFTIHNNGWSIDVKTDEESTEDALDFWTEFVEGRI